MCLLHSHARGDGDSLRQGRKSSRSVGASGPHRRRTPLLIAAVIVTVVLLFSFVAVPLLVLNKLDRQRVVRRIALEDSVLVSSVAVLTNAIRDTLAAAVMLEGFVQSTLQELYTLSMQLGAEQPLLTVSPPLQPLHHELLYERSHALCDVLHQRNARMHRYSFQVYERFEQVARLIANTQPSLAVQLIIPDGIIQYTFPNDPMLNGHCLLNESDPLFNYPPRPIDTLRSGKTSIVGPYHAPTPLLQDIWAIVIRKPVYNASSPSEYNIDNFWGFTSTTLNLTDVLVQHTLVQNMTRDRMNFILYTRDHNDTFSVVAASPALQRASREAQLHFVHTASVGPTIFGNVNLTLVAQSVALAPMLTPECLCSIICISVFIALLLLLVMVAVIERCTRTYDGRVYAPKLTPFAVLTVGPCYGEELWNLVPVQMAEVMDRLGRVLNKQMAVHHAYRVAKMQPYTMVFVLRTVEAAVRMSFDVITELQRHPIDADLATLLDEDGQLLMAYAVHLCTDVAVVPSVTGDCGYHYEGVDMVYGARMWAFSAPNTVTLSAAAQPHACAMRGGSGGGGKGGGGSVEVAALALVRMPYSTEAQQLYTATDTHRAALRRAIAVAAAHASKSQYVKTIVQACCQHPHGYIPDGEYEEGGVDGGKGARRASACDDGESDDGGATTTTTTTMSDDEDDEDDGDDDDDDDGEGDKKSEKGDDEDGGSGYDESDGSDNVDERHRRRRRRRRRSRHSGDGAAAAAAVGGGGRGGEVGAGGGAGCQHPCRHRRRRHRSHDSADSNGNSNNKKNNSNNNNNDDGNKDDNNGNDEAEDDDGMRGSGKRNKGDKHRNSSSGGNSDKDRDDEGNEGGKDDEQAAAAAANNPLESNSLITLLDTSDDAPCVTSSMSLRTSARASRTSVLAAAAMAAVASSSAAMTDLLLLRQQQQLQRQRRRRRREQQQQHCRMLHSDSEHSNCAVAVADVNNSSSCSHSRSSSSSHNNNNNNAGDGGSAACVLVSLSEDTGVGVAEAGSKDGKVEEGGGGNVALLQLPPLRRRPRAQRTHMVRPPSHDGSRSRSSISGSIRSNSSGGSSSSSGGGGGVFAHAARKNSHHRLHISSANNSTHSGSGDKGNDNGDAADPSANHMDDNAVRGRRHGGEAACSAAATPLCAVALTSLQQATVSHSHAAAAAATTTTVMVPSSPIAVNAGTAMTPTHVARTVAVPALTATPLKSAAMGRARRPSPACVPSAAAAALRHVWSGSRSSSGSNHSSSSSSRSRSRSSMIISPTQLTLTRPSPAMRKPMQQAPQQAQAQRSEAAEQKKGKSTVASGRLPKQAKQGQQQQQAQLLPLQKHARGRRSRKTRNTAWLTVEVDTMTQQLLHPVIPLWLDKALCRAFEHQSIALEVSYESVRVMVYYFYASYKLLFRPLAAPERDNIYRRLITAFGIPRKDILEHLAARCTIHYMQQHEHTKSLAWKTYA